MRQHDQVVVPKRLLKARILARLWRFLATDQHARGVVRQHAAQFAAAAVRHGVDEEGIRPIGREGAGDHRPVERLRAVLGDQAAFDRVEGDQLHAGEALAPDQMAGLAVDQEQELGPRIALADLTGERQLPHDVAEPEAVRRVDQEALRGHLFHPDSTALSAAAAP